MRAALARVGRRNWVGLAVVAAATAGLIAFHAAYVEPRAWGTICAAAEGAPIACVPRAAAVWLQTQYAWGDAALALGLWAFLARGPFVVCVAAVVVGAGGVEFYNATWSLLGAALGAWTWLRVAATRPA